MLFIILRVTLLLLLCFFDHYDLFIIKELSVLANTSNGIIRGKLMDTPNGYPFYAFLQIPYATPPIGVLRFKRPLPVRNWTGILNTTENTKICWEIRKNKKKNDPRENEDCLYLNIYIPKNPKTDELLPVMFYITGGLFNFNDGTFKSYKPYLFVEEDVITVFINFRQGVLGFLSSGDRIIPGNIGLWDQNMALKWIMKNIKHFGGNPNKVTLMGHSSGSTCVNFHIYSKKSSGLFQAAITSSGSALSTRSIHTDPKYFAYKLASSLCPDFTTKNSSEDLLRLLNSFSPDILSNTTLTMPLDPTYNGTFLKKQTNMIWTPVREDPNDEEAFFTGLPHDDAEKGNINKVPLLTGITSEEAGQFIRDENDARLLDKPAALVPGSSSIKQDKRSLYTYEVKQLYTTKPFIENMTALIKVEGDLSFAFPVIRYADLHSIHANVYFYQFSYFGEMNHQNLPQFEGLEYVGHTGELPYLVYYEMDNDTRDYPPSDYVNRKRLGRLFSNFIKYQNPTPKKDPLLQNVMWPKFTPSNHVYLDINRNLTIKINPRNYNEWLPIFKKYYDHPLFVL